MSRAALLGATVAVAATLGGCANELVVLLPDEDGRVGRLSVDRRWSDTVLLDSAWAATRSELVGGTGAVTLPEAQVRSEFAGALAAVPPAPVSYTLYFEEGTTSVVPASRPVLEEMLADVRARAVSDVEVTGHTDRVGGVEDNDVLARQRATMVRAVLIRQGLDPQAVRAVGRGEREPLVATADGVREPRNRRVEIIVR